MDMQLAVKVVLNAEEEIQAQTTEEFLFHLMDQFSKTGIAGEEKRICYETATLIRGILENGIV